LILKKTIKIGTRDSQLALWQANTVKNLLQKNGYNTQIVKVKSTGDLDTTKPLYSMGIVGVFTKTLDQALLSKKIDIAVHSMKDVPTLLPKGIVQTAVLERAATQDILVIKNKINLKNPCTIATGSLRRKAQWLHRFPHHQVVNLRGNVNSRLQKLQEQKWDGAIFAKAGLERIHLLPEEYVQLDWMIPAPAQGAMVITTREEDVFAVTATKQLNHNISEICTTIERQFLQTLEGGCTAPIGGLAMHNKGKINFKGVLFSLDSTQKIEVEKEIETAGEITDFGKRCAQEILDKGGDKIMKAINNELQS
jgi:hydroxymethylbilane synthase